MASPWAIDNTMGQSQHVVDEQDWTRVGRFAATVAVGREPHAEGIYAPWKDRGAMQQL